MKYAFLESHALFYLGYRDAETGKTLVAEPGGVYDVLPEMPPDGRWGPVPEEPVKKVLPSVRDVRAKLADSPAVTDDDEPGKPGEGA